MTPDVSIVIQASPVVGATHSPAMKLRNSADMYEPLEKRALAFDR